MKFIGVALINDIIWGSGAHFYNTSSVYCIVLPQSLTLIHGHVFDSLYLNIW